MESRRKNAGTNLRTHFMTVRFEAYQDAMSVVEVVARSYGQLGS